MNQLTIDIKTDMSTDKTEEIEDDIVQLLCNKRLEGSVENKATGRLIRFPKKILLKENTLVWLGFYRDKIPEKAVKELQKILRDN